MKLRVTKGRIACAVILAPVLYVLNTGPMMYCVESFGLSQSVLAYIYDPIAVRIENTPLNVPYRQYVNWWMALPHPGGKLWVMVK